jgi:hypothetical protein
MTTTREFAAGGYRFIPGPFQYSGGVAALRGYRIQRVPTSDKQAIGPRSNEVTRIYSKRQWFGHP